MICELCDVEVGLRFFYCCWCSRITCNACEAESNSDACKECVKDNNVSHSENADMEPN